MKCCCCARSGFMSSVLVGTLIIASAMGLAWFTSDRAARSAAEDPITGDWEGTASGDAFPEDLQLTVSLEMDEEFTVTGVFSTFDDDAPFEGEFDAEKKTLTGTVTPPDETIWELALTLEDDELNGEATEETSGATATILLERSEEE